MGLTLFKIQKETTLNEVFPISFYLKTFITAAVAAIPVLYLKYYLVFPYQVKLIILFCIYFIVYAIVASATRVISKEDWMRLLHGVKLKSR